MVDVDGFGREGKFALRGCWVIVIFIVRVIVRIVLMVGGGVSAFLVGAGVDAMSSVGCTDVAADNCFVSIVGEDAPSHTK